MLKKRLIPLFTLAIGLALSALSARAQDIASGKKPPPVAAVQKLPVQKHYFYGGAGHDTAPSWGLTERTWSRLGATELQPDGSATTYTSSWFPEISVFSYQRWVTGGYAHLIGFGHVPGGASISSFALTYCETNAAPPFATISWYMCDRSGNCTSPAFDSFDFGIFGTGCHDVTSFPSPVTMNNGNNELMVDIFFAHTDGSESIGSAGFGYNLQLSPAPGTPTFSDVPLSDTAYAFVEAFVSAGITVGCDAGPPARYCPDDFVTRRQMAVFIAKALGLDWSDF
jgi:hypothetical protein